MTRPDRITTAEAAARLGVGRRAVVLLIQKGQLPATRLARGWAIDPADLAHIPHSHAGRPPRISAETWRAVDLALAQPGQSSASVARQFGIHESTIQRHRARRGSV